MKIGKKGLIIFILILIIQVQIFRLSIGYGFLTFLILLRVFAAFSETGFFSPSQKKYITKKQYDEFTN